MFPHNERGFTLPELLVAVGVIMMIVVVSVVLVRPTSYSAEMNSAQRHADVAQLAQALQRYKAAHGQFPPNIPSEATTIGSEQPQYVLCAALVPDFAKDIPLDPEAGLKYKDSDGYPETNEACNNKDVVYTAGYTVKRSADGAITVGAPLAQHEKVEITVR